MRRGSWHALLRSVLFSPAPLVGLPWPSPPYEWVGSVYCFWVPGLSHVALALSRCLDFHDDSSIFSLCPDSRGMRCYFLSSSLEVPEMFIKLKYSLHWLLPKICFMLPSDLCYSYFPSPLSPPSFSSSNSVNIPTSFPFWLLYLLFFLPILHILNTFSFFRFYFKYQLFRGTL